MTTTGVSCSYCLEGTNGIRILCYTCKDFTLCLQCFAARAEIGPHKSDHDYQFVGAEQTFFRNSSNWSASEEMELLNGIEHCGNGNWEAIARRIESRTAEEACREYFVRYVDGVMGKVWTQGTEGSFKILDLTQDSAPMRRESLAISVPEPLHESLGYKPLRGDFETEYDNDAEKILTRLNLNVLIDDELDIALKLANVSMYHSCLKERERRKQTVADYSLINKFFSYRRDRFRNAQRPPGEREVSQKLRWLCRFRSAKDYDCIVKSIQRQRDLRHRLKELMKYRKNGITKIEELTHFEQETRASSKRFDSTLGGNRTVPLKKNRDRSDSWYFHIKKSTHRTLSRVFSHDVGRQSSLMRQQTLPTVLQRPSEHLLSEREVKLCSDLRLAPSTYMGIKVLLLTVPIKHSSNHIVQQIFEFMKFNGWLNS